MKYFVPLILALVSCFAVQAVALKSVGGRTIKSESNFFSSIGRIQAGAKGDPQIMLLGSSITGRLPDRTQGYEGVVNMGCDGGSAVDVLRAIDEGILPHAPYVVVEANTLHMALEGDSSAVGMAMRRPWFRAGLKYDAVAAYARPSSFFYSKLLAHRIGAFRANKGIAGFNVDSRPEIIELSSESEISPDEEVLVCELSEILVRLREKGSEVYIVWLPPARKANGPTPRWILEVARRSGLPYWDLGRDVPIGSIQLTDGVHMDALSATGTLVTVLNQIIDKLSK